jgi:hypothetical protein
MALGRPSQIKDKEKRAACTWHWQIRNKRIAWPGMSKNCNAIFLKNQGS